MPYKVLLVEQYCWTYYYILVMSFFMRYVSLRLCVYKHICAYLICSVYYNIYSGSVFSICNSLHRSNLNYLLSQTIVQLSMLKFPTFLSANLLLIEKANFNESPDITYDRCLNCVTVNNVVKNRIISFCVKIIIKDHLSYNRSLEVFPRPHLFDLKNICDFRIAQ